MTPVEFEVKDVISFHQKYLPEPNSGCWIWEAATNAAGYGVFGLKTRKTVLAHRLSWIIHNGAFDVSLSVLHKCDNPSCVNPVHLFLGTHTDNMRDCARKGRYWTQKDPNAGPLSVPGLVKRPSGEQHNRAKLTWELVDKIRVRGAQGEKAKELSKDFWVDPSQINRILRGAMWKK